MRAAGGWLAALAVIVVACARAPEPGDPLRNLTQAERERFLQGRAVFDSVFNPTTGLGPLFNAPGCIACHNGPVAGGGSPVSEIHASAFSTADGFCDPLAAQGGPVYQLRVTDALRQALGIEREPIPAAADTAVRTTPDVFGFGLLDAVPEATLMALADPNDADGDGISGRVNRFFDGRVGRFGRKALVPTLAEFNEGAFLLEQGVTTPNAPEENSVAGDPLPPGVDPALDPEIGATALARVNDYVRFLAPPRARDLTTVGQRGQTVFNEIGCAKCHVPELRTGDHPVRAIANQTVAAYTDLLLHDMGPELADICLGLVAVPGEFRTEPLMGLRFASRLLHDGRAGSIEQAIQFHGGESAASRSAFDSLSDADRTAILEFLRSL